MTLDFNAWLVSGDSTVMSAQQRAVLAWRRIQDRPTSIVLRRGTVDLSAQTMRVEYNNTASWVDGTLVRTGKQMLTLFGIRDHPTIANTDIQRGDRVVINGAQFQVMSVLYPPGEVQALLES